jgi:hypothetical protein
MVACNLLRSDLETDRGRARDARSRGLVHCPTGRMERPLSDGASAPRGTCVSGQRTRHLNVVAAFCGRGLCPHDVCCWLALWGRGLRPPGPVVPPRCALRHSFPPRPPAGEAALRAARFGGRVEPAKVSAAGRARECFPNRAHRTRMRPSGPGRARADRAPQQGGAGLGSLHALASAVTRRRAVRWSTRQPPSERIERRYGHS